MIDSVMCSAQSRVGAEQAKRRAQMQHRHGSARGKEVGTQCV